MILKILLPYKQFQEVKNVIRIVAETTLGSLGILPQRLDCVASLVPGIFLYETEAGKVNYLAVDEGLLTKAGDEIRVSVRNAYGSENLEKLEETVKKDFMAAEKLQKEDKAMLSKLEIGFIRSLNNFRKAD